MSELENSPAEEKNKIWKHKKYVVEFKLTEKQ
jgi:hypothetical protein